MRLGFPVRPPIRSYSHFKYANGNPLASYNHETPTRRSHSYCFAAFTLGMSRLPFIIANILWGAEAFVAPSLLSGRANAISESRQWCWGKES